MKLWAVSDLHCDHYPWTPAHVPAHDVMIIAGDVHNSADDAIIELYVIAQRTRRLIVFVPGNHDHFGSTLVEQFDGLSSGTVCVLSSGQSVIIGGVRFVGATLWTDFGLADDLYGSEAWAAKHMPEYQHVRRSDGTAIWPADTSEAHRRHRAAIEAVLSQQHLGPTIVITHHGPSRRSIAGAVDVADAAFASDLEPMIMRHQPSLWVHGHVHQHLDYLIGNTRIIANPRGYQGDDHGEDSGFIEDLIVELGEIAR